MVFNRWGCARLLSDVKISNGIINCEKNDKIRALIAANEWRERKRRENDGEKERKKERRNNTEVWQFSSELCRSFLMRAIGFHWFFFSWKEKKLLHPYLYIVFPREVRDRIKNIKDLSQSFGYPCFNRSVWLAYHNNENGLAVEEDRNRCLDMFLFIYVCYKSFRHCCYIS